MSRNRNRGERAAVLALLLALLPAAALAVREGQPAPDFSLQRLDGDGRASLAAQRGKVVVIDFWASWCHPCVRSLPELGRLQRELGPRGLVVLAVSIDEERASAERIVRAGRHPFVPLHDPDSGVANRYGVDERLPATVVVDRRGTVRLARFGSAVEHGQLRRLVESLL